MTARHGMRRREMTLLFGAAVTWPLAVRAQRSSPLIGFIGGASAAAWRPLVAAFRDGLRSTGLVEGKDVAIEFRWADGERSRLPALAAELVRRDAAVLVATGGPLAVRAAMAATGTTPIVFTLASDPVEHGLVASLARPGGNVTGITMIAHSLLPKKLELLDAIVPKGPKVAMLVNPANPSWKLYAGELEATAAALRRPVEFIEARDERDFDGVFAALVQQRVGGLLVIPDPIFDRNSRFISLAMQRSIPTMYTWREDVEAGGLLSYGISVQDGYRQVGVYAGRILKGEKPSELPVLQPTKVELAINLRTAKALGLAVPDAILARADAVIE